MAWKIWSTPHSVTFYMWVPTVGPTGSHEGLGNPATVPALVELVKAKRPDIVFLFETLAIFSRIEALRVQLNFQACFNVNCVGCSGGICVF